MIYSFSLSQVAVWLGFGLLLTHGWGLFDYAKSSAWWKSFPRSDMAGGGLLTLATIWAAWLAGTINLMEYTRFRPLFILGVIGLGVTSWLYVREFIAVRALGVLLLLGANVLLDAAFLREDAARLVVVAYAYVIIVKGMFMVGAPYLLRDAIDWGFATPARGKAFLGVGLFFGIVLLGLGLFVY
ncbi:MAG: hypothetical protein NTZ01_03435 [Verrucomicrobia bacterium]|nr:hypothetical protein [Verrucomicrobiota bacterium]